MGKHLLHRCLQIAGTAENARERNTLKPGGLSIQLMLYNLPNLLQRKECQQANIYTECDFMIRMITFSVVGILSGK